MLPSESGMRRTEMANLMLDDVDLANGTMVVRRSKTGKPCVVPIGLASYRLLLSNVSSARYNKHTGEEIVATMSVTSNEGALGSASAVLEVIATNPAYNQPALRIRQAGQSGGAASIRIDDPNPDIEFVEADQVAPAGKYEIAVQSDKLQINGRNSTDTGFETVAVFQRLAAGGNVGLRTASQFGAGRGVVAIANAAVRAVGQSCWRWDFVYRGRGAEVSGFERNSNDYRARLGCS